MLHICMNFWWWLWGPCRLAIPERWTVECGVQTDVGSTPPTHLAEIICITKVVWAQNIVDIFLVVHSCLMITWKKKMSDHQPTWYVLFNLWVLILPKFYLAKHRPRHKHSPAIKTWFNKLSEIRNRKKIDLLHNNWWFINSSEIVCKQINEIISQRNAPYMLFTWHQTFVPRHFLEKCFINAPYMTFSVPSPQVMMSHIISVASTWVMSSPAWYF